jgi:hypothetical protein
MQPPHAVMTCMPSDATWHKKQEYACFKGNNLKGFGDIWTLPVSRGRNHHVMP